jgi:GMP synthase (glutamine-hydrolysing)
MRREYGFAALHLAQESPIFTGLGPEETVWMSHGDSVVSLPDGFAEVGYSIHEDAEVPAVRQAAARAGGIAGTSTQVAHRNAAIANEKLRRYGFQFHPEVDDTEHGEEMLANFAIRICGCKADWTIANYIEEHTREIRELVGDQRVFLLASGGVDSTVLARLLVAALGKERVHLLHIDNGLMRKDESAQVLARFRSWGLVDNLHFADATDDFLRALDGLVDPERKRVAIGNTFMEVCQREMERLGVGDALLAQGTIYPDTIETGGTSRADVIKTHHNRVPLVAEMIRAGKVIEPLRELYKVEVRELGAALGLEQAFIDRHPFPGPGLGVRLLCHGPGGPSPEVAGELARISAASAEIAAVSGLGAVALPIQSVGVKADLRAYEWPVFLHDRAAAATWKSVETAANRIYREVDGVNRCVYDLTGSAGARGSAPRFAIREAYITRPRLDLLRAADAIMMSGLDRYGLMEPVWQCPTAMLPISVDGRGEELVVVRPVLSERAMTARPAELPAGLRADLGREMAGLPGVSGLCIDVTTKPPGTIEWE